jgi:hypothetical protein
LVKPWYFYQQGWAPQKDEIDIRNQTEVFESSQGGGVLVREDPKSRRGLSFVFI